MRKSIYAQLVLIFIFIIFLGNFASYIIAGSNIQLDLKNEFSNSLNGVLFAARDAYEKGDVAADDIEKLYAPGFIAVEFYDDADKLSKDYNLSAVSLKTVGEMPTVFEGKSKAGFHIKIPISVLKSKDTYLVSSLRGDNIFSDVSAIVLSYYLLSLIFGTIVMLIAARFIISPIRKLTDATERIARGDFKVHVKEKRKDEIGKLIGNFNKMAGELAGIEILRSNFVSDMSHEFKTPLTSIEGYTKLLRDCKSDLERNEYIDIIIEETKRLSALSGNILLLNRIENENITSVKNSFRLDEQIRHVILLSENKWSTKNIDLNIDLDEIMYTGNEQLLFQVWLNLFENAIKFSNPDEAIEISLKKTEDKIVFSILDYGKGMTDEQQKRMFEKFYTGDKSRNMEGNGLGLSIAKRIVDMHGGTIEVKSRLYEFTQVKVIL